MINIGYIMLDILVIIHIAYRASFLIYIVCLTDNNYTIMILWTNNISIRALGVLRDSSPKMKFCHHLLTPQVVPTCMNFFVLLNTKEDIWRKFVTRLFWGTIDFHCRKNFHFWVNYPFNHTSLYLILIELDQDDSERILCCCCSNETRAHLIDQINCMLLYQCCCFYFVDISASLICTFSWTTLI